MNVVGRPGYDFDGNEAPFAWVPLLLAFLRRSWRMILACAAAAMLLGAAYAVLATPKFTATTQLLIDTRQGNAFQQQSSATPDSLADSAIVDSQVEVLRSDGTARHAVAQLKLTQDQEFLSWGGSGGGSGYSPRAWLNRLVGLIEPPAARIAMPEDDASQATERLQGMSSIRRIGLSNVIEVAVQSPSPARSAQLANALTAAYIDDTLRAKYDITRQAAAWLQDRLKELRDQSTAADRALQEQKARIGLVDTDKGGMNEQALGDLTLQLGNARARSAETAARYSRIQAITAAGLTSSGSVVDALANTIILKLQQQYLDDARRLVEWTARYGAQHAAVLNLGREMAGLRASLGDELQRIQETYKSDYDVARGNEAALQRQVDGLVAVSTATNGARAQIRSLESLADTYRALYGSFLQRYTQAAQDQSFPISQARTISPATPPLRKSAPATGLVMLGATVAGLGLGVAASLVREVTDQRFRTAAQVAEVTGLECIGVLPRLGRRRRESAAPVSPGTIPLAPARLRAVVDRPRLPFAEAVRRLRMRVMDARGRSPGVIGITSAAAGEGRSTLAANLAQGLAASGQRTILIDGDQRRPQLTRWMAPGGGFSTLAGEAAALAGAIWRDAATGLAFLPAPAVESQHLQAVMEALRVDFDRVVIDLPALANLADAPLARFVDGFIVLVEWSRTQQQTLVDGLEAADIDAARLLGVVLTKVDLRALHRLSAPGRYRALAGELEA